MNRDRLRDRRASAMGEAESLLRSRGFEEGKPRTWLGVLRDASGTGQSVRLLLPERFPDVLPEVYLDDSGSTPLAHVDNEGKICIAPETGVLLDTTRPQALIDEALARAQRVLCLTPEEHTRERLAEFSAYWSTSQPPRHIYSICPMPLATGEVVLCDIPSSFPFSLIAPNIETARAWTKRTEHRITGNRPAFALALLSPLEPPAYEKTLHVGDLAEIANTRATPESAEALRQWLERIGLPTTVLLSQTIPPGSDSVAFAVNLPEPNVGRVGRWQNGFRDGRAPTSRQITFAKAEPMLRWSVTRLDPAFLLERGGGDVRLLNKRVAVIGCGAIGSHAALALAAAGVGALYLVDHERLEAANLQRHALGAEALGQLKVDGLRDVVQAKYPHVEVTVAGESVLDVIRDGPGALDQCSLLIIALGDETIELRLNELLLHVHRIHVWLEPRGLGGHSLATGFAGTGCYACLFRSDPKHGLVNMSAMSEAGQAVQSTIGGCAGVFTQFGDLDAQRAAIEATRQAIRILRNDLGSAELNSWQTDRREFEAAGHVLSPRGKMMAVGALETVSLKSGCPVCLD